MHMAPFLAENRLTVLTEMIGCHYGLRWAILHARFFWFSRHHCIIPLAICMHFTKQECLLAEGQRSTLNVRKWGALQTGGYWADFRQSALVRSR